MNSDGRQSNGRGKHATSACVLDATPGARSRGLLATPLPDRQIGHETTAERILKGQKEEIFFTSCPEKALSKGCQFRIRALSKLCLSKNRFNILFY